MTSLIIPKEWASSTNYSSGPDTGTPTKVDSASATNGFIRGVGAAAQHVNFELNAHSIAARRALTVALTSLRYLPLQTGGSVTDTAESMAAVQSTAGAPILLVKTAQAFNLSDMQRLNVNGIPTDVTANMRAAASNGTRIVAMGGTGGNRVTYSDDNGGTWTQGADPNAGNAVGNDLVWSFTNSKFFTTVAPAKLASSSNGAAAWSLSSGSSANIISGIATLANGNIIVMSTSTPAPGFVISTDGGATLAATGGTVSSSGSYDDNGYIAGVGGTSVYHVGRINSGASLRINSSADGTTWTFLAGLGPPSGCTFSAKPRIMRCPNTEMLAIAAPISDGTFTQTAIFASVDGVTWLGPSLAFPAPGTTGVSIAGGRIFATRDDLFFGTDGCGV